MVLHPVTGASVATVVLLGVWLLVWSGAFALRHVTVTGLPRTAAAGAPTLSEAQVRAAADVARGTPLATVDASAVRQRVERLPIVAAATVSRRWPSTLAISVRLRQAVAELAGPGGPRLLDATGDAFAPAPASDTGLVTVSVTGAVPGPGTAGLRAAMGVLRALPPAVRTELHSISADGPESVTLALSGGRHVQWGSAADSHSKGIVLAALLVAPATRGAHSFDVSSPTVVAVR